MRRFFSGLLLAALLGSAQAADATPPAAPADTPAAAPVLEVTPDRMGYAAGRPEILLRQRLFGRAHGLSLLTATCLELPAYSAAIQGAYSAWYANQAGAIATVVRDLAAYYFGPRAAEARWSDLTRALNLPESIEPALGEVTLHSACASLAEAMPRPRYELDKFLAGTAVLEAVPGDTAAVAGPRSGIPGTQGEPAPTMQRPAE